MNKKTRFLTEGALVAALYTVLTYIVNLAGLANGVIQIRLSEALAVLPAFMPSSVWGLYIGCFTANILTGAALPDIIFGSAATLLGALGTRHFGKNSFLAVFFPILANTAVVPLVLKTAYGAEQGYFILALSVFAGEFVSCGIFGTILYKKMTKIKKTLL